jgi:hypothetical protein
VVTRSDSAEFVRSLVRGDYDATDEYEKRLDEQGWSDFPKFLSAAFFLAVERRFPRGFNQADVIHFVADLRAHGRPGAPEFDPSAAEAMIGAVLNPSIDFDLHQEAIGQIQTLVVHKVLADENLDDAELDQFLGDAEALATRG